MSILRNWLVTLGPYSTGVVYRLWGGGGSLIYGGETYDGVGGLARISEVETAVDAIDRRVTLSLTIPDETLRSHLLTDPGAVPIEIRWIYSETEGEWRPVPRIFRGFLSGPRLENDRYDIEVETYSGDVDRGQVRYVSQETLQAEHANARGLEFMASLTRGFVRTFPQ